MLLLAKCWLVGALLIFTFSTNARRIRYLIPVFPAVALLAADVMARAGRGELRERMQGYVRRLASWGTYALCAAPFALFAIWLVRIPDMRGWALASAAVAAVGAAVGVYLHRVRRLRWAPLLALAIVLIGAKKGVSRRELLKRAALGVLTVGAMPTIFRPWRALADVPAEGAAAMGPEAWSFGVMADTQWTCPSDPAGQNPHTVAVSIIRQLNEQFIKAGVKFVMQVGDLTNEGRDDAIAERAAAARPLYEAGIGLFPMRGNHETYSRYPNGYGVPAFRRCFPQTRGVGDTFGARRFSSPTAVSPDLDGMSYSFDCGPPGGAVRFVAIDNWATPTRMSGMPTYPFGYSLAEQQAWIDGRLSGAGRDVQHKFVLAHQPLMAESHQDSLFDGYTNAHPAWQNAFFASLEDNGVALYVSGHDHIHERSLITSPDGRSTVEQLICASNSSKFYTPKPPQDPHWFGQKVREKSLGQDRYTIGYYIVTVEGPQVRVEYWADDHGQWHSDARYPDPGYPAEVTPALRFVKKDAWTYGAGGMARLTARTAAAI